MITIVGSIGAFLLAICAVPETYRSVKRGTCELGYPFLLTWLIGEILLLIYVVVNRDIILLLNYLVNIICLIIMFYYKLLEKK